MKERANRKSGSNTAKIYLFATGITLVLLIISVLIIFAVLINTDKKPVIQSENEKVFSAYRPKEDDGMTVLFGLEEDNALKGLVLVRFSPFDKEIRCTAIPVETLVKLYAKTSTLSGHYERGGVKHLIPAVQDAYNVTVHRYMVLDGESFAYAIDKLGGVYYQVDRDIYYKDEKTDSVTQYRKDDPVRLFDGDDVRKLVTYPSYSEGSLYNSKVLVVLVAATINQSVNYREEISCNIDVYATRLIPMTKTNITEEDYLSGKDGLLWIYENSKSPATVYMPEGTLNDKGEFIADAEAGKRINEYLLG